MITLSMPVWVVSDRRIEAGNSFRCLLLAHKCSYIECSSCVTYLKYSFSETQNLSSLEFCSRNYLESVFYCDYFAHNWANSVTSLCVFFGSLFHPLFSQNQQTLNMFWISVSLLNLIGISQQAWELLTEKLINMNASSHAFYNALVRLQKAKTRYNIGIYFQ